MRSSPDSMGPARSISARMTSDFGTLLRFAHRARRSARFLSSLTVMVGMVIPRYYRARLMSGAAPWTSTPLIERRGRIMLVTPSRLKGADDDCYPKRIPLEVREDA